MKMQHTGHVIGVPSKTLQLEPAKQYYLPSSYSSKYGPFIANLVTKLTNRVKRKLSLGAKILRPGGVEKIFEHYFSVKEGEKLLKASQCYISTTAGPILGLLFISTHKISFCSEKSIKFSSKNGDLVRIRYKVVIPIGKIARVNESQNVKNPSEKYIEIVSVDGYDFWFLGFLSYRKTLEYLQQSIFELQ